MGGVYGQRCQHRIDLVLVVGRQPLPVRLAQQPRLQEAETLGLQRRSQILGPASIGIPHECPDSLGHHPQTVAGRETIGHTLPPLRLDVLLEPGDADLEEFIQVGMGDPEEFDPLQQWD